MLSIKDVYSKSPGRWWNLVAGSTVFRLMLIRGKMSVDTQYAINLTLPTYFGDRVRLYVTGTATKLLTSLYIYRQYKVG